jgi:hypothetical protein
LLTVRVYIIESHSDEKKMKNMQTFFPQLVHKKVNKRVIIKKCNVRVEREYSLPKITTRAQKSVASLLTSFFLRRTTQRYNNNNNRKR